MIETFFMGIIMWIIGIITIPLLFWPLLAFECWWLISATEEESIGSAFFATIFGTTLGILEFGSFSGLWLAIKHNPLILGVGTIAFFIIGTMWARFKWGMYASDKAKEINNYIQANGIEKSILFYSTYVNGERNHNKIRETSFTCLVPKVEENKKKVITWIILWIPSMTWFLLNNPIRRIGNWIFDNIKGYFQNVSDNIFKKSLNIADTKEEV